MFFNMMCLLIRVITIEMTGQVCTYTHIETIIFGLYIQCCWLPGDIIFIIDNNLLLFSFITSLCNIISLNNE